NYWLVLDCVICYTNTIWNRTRIQKDDIL
ncbi:uncharacterized protein METZ01_LOCUS237717, partial [marine metagenome]